MKLWPEPSSTVVSARRVVSAGISKPLSVIAPSEVSSDTSGRTRIEMRPPSSTVGVKARLTPYSLNSIAVPLIPFDAAIGNSPPARKLAVSPDKAVSVGSAKVVTRPLFSLRSMALATFTPKSSPSRLKLLLPSGFTNAPSSVMKSRPVEPKN